MIDRREHLGFPIEPGEALRIPGELRWQRFDRDITIEPGIAGTIHLAHPAFAKLGDHGVRADATADHPRDYMVGRNQAQFF
jgi:hypothetical protein